jgi:hypothetical protein
LTGERFGAEGQPANWENASGHNYLRLVNPQADTAIYPFGGTLLRAEALPGTDTFATYIPAFPIYPPEISWMRQPASDLPAVVRRVHPSGGRTVYFAADIDRCYGRRGLPDHANLLADALRWALGERLPLTVDGPGRIDCHLYRQDKRLILHLVNLSGCDSWGYLEENLPVGPLRIEIRLPEGIHPVKAVGRVNGEVLPLALAGGWARVELPRLVDHELLVLE